MGGLSWDTTHGKCAAACYLSWSWGREGSQQGQFGPPVSFYNIWASKFFWQASGYKSLMLRPAQEPPTAILEICQKSWFLYCTNTCDAFMLSRIMTCHEDVQGGCCTTICCCCIQKSLERVKKINSKELGLHAFMPILGSGYMLNDNSFHDEKAHRIIHRMDHPIIHVDVHR